MENTRTVGAPTHVQDSRGLTSLPFEVLSHILTLVDCSDILTLKLTCKAIHSAMMTRQFWYIWILRLCKGHHITPPEEGLDNYTITELEQWTVRRIPIRGGVPWKLKIRHLESSRPMGAYEYIQFIPGGRWLLVTYSDMLVYFFDLDNIDLKQHLLLNPRDVNPSIGSCPMFAHCIWIDHEASRLSFHYGVIFRTNDEDGLQIFHVFIYQVNLVGHGASATLVAQIIATFRSLAKDASFSLCTLNCRYFIRGASSTIGHKLEIFDYRQTLGCFDSPLIDCHTVPLPESPWGIQFINKDIFAVDFFGQTFCHIFSVESSTSINLLHKIYKMSAICSRICWTPGASLMTLVEWPRNNGMHSRDRVFVLTLQGLVIPHDSKLPPRTVELGKFVHREDAYLRLGIFISLSYKRPDGMSFISHEWAYTSSISGDLVYTSLAQDRLPSLWEFDEDTGRSIHFNEGLYVVDIVPAG